MNELYKTEDDVVTITIPDPPDAFFPPPEFADGPAKFPPPKKPPPSGNEGGGEDVIIFTGTNPEGQNTAIICNGGSGCILATQQPDGTYKPN